MIQMDVDKGEFSQNKTILLLLFLFIFSLILRISWLNFESAWIDEAYSIQLSAKSIKEIIVGCINDQHPPLFYIILKFWMGNSLNVGKARLFSALIGSINILQVFLILKEIKIINLKSIIITCLYISISPMHIWYSQEARMYTLLLFFVLLSILIYIKLINNMCQHTQKTKNSLWILFILINIFSLYTHYSSIFIIIFEFIFFLYFISIKKIDFKKRNIGIFSFFAIGIAFFPWAPVLINQTLTHKLAWIAEPTLFSVISSINRLLFGPIVIILPQELNVLLFFMFFTLLIFGFIKFFGTSNNNIFFSLFLIFWIIIPLLLISLLSMYISIFQFKQLIIILIPTIAITVFLIFSTFQKFGKYIILGLLTINLFSSIYQQINLSKDDWRGLTDFIEDNNKYGDIIYFNTSAGQLGYKLYQTENLAVFGYPQNYDVIKGGWDGTEINLENESIYLRNLKQNYNRIWYVQYYPDLWDPNKLIYDWFNDNYNPQLEKSFGSILLILYD